MYEREEGSFRHLHGPNYSGHLLSCCHATKDTTTVAVPFLHALLLSFLVYALFYLAYAWFDVCTALANAC